ncbi:hypothetical protein NQ317_007806 [Molorchus minor]|uniref:Carboxylesterase type B domain-containing protein n=1 Tax=Molorchus minor TaxID=1323400 RepID=A0ABQ9JIV6_9CUCU|nr:hypothetical protein NQ317_007806 [Molorchus minor]
MAYSVFNYQIDNLNLENTLWDFAFELANVELLVSLSSTQIFQLSTEARHPVIVYIHGESFEWNSGNPYDGSVLASYADLVVVTLNYRLGILEYNQGSNRSHKLTTTIDMEIPSVFINVTALMILI